MVRSENGEVLQSPVMELELALATRLKLDALTQLGKHQTFFILDLGKGLFSQLLEDSIRENPVELQKQLEPSIQDFADKNMIDARVCLLFRDWKFTAINPRSINVRHTTKLVCVEGMVTAASRTEPLECQTTYECSGCGNLFMVENKLLAKTLVRECPRCGEKNIQEASHTLKDTKLLYVQDLPNGLKAGQNAVTLRIMLHEAIAQQEFASGQKVRINGVLTTISSRKNGTILDYLLIAYDVVQMEDTLATVEITKEEETEIHELSLQPDIYDKLWHSIAPSLYNLEEIKQGLLLQAMGGTKQTMGDGMEKRGNIHIFLVGDPASAKSAILRFMRGLMPKSVYAQGTGASGVGLTATVTRDEVTGKWMLKAGAAILADGGLLIVDELDKATKEDIDDLDESLESGQVTIHKATINQTMPAEYSCLAAANPKKGRFNPYKTISEQVDMVSPAFLSRFDLRFLLLDKPSREKDEKLARHIIGSMLEKEKTVSPIRQDLLRKYISYARNHCTPTLPLELGEVIAQKYVEIRHSRLNSEDEVVHLTPRQLEGFVRLATASAKTRLSPVVEAVDVERAISLFNKTLEYAGGDIDHAEGRPSAGKRKNTELLLDVISTGLDSLVSMDYLLDEMEKHKVERRETMELVEQMKRSGTLYEPKSGMVGKT